MPHSKWSEIKRSKGVPESKAPPTWTTFREITPEIQAIMDDADNGLIDWEDGYSVIYLLPHGVYTYLETKQVVCLAHGPDYVCSTDDRLCNWTISS